MAASGATRARLKAIATLTGATVKLLSFPPLANAVFLINGKSPLCRLIGKTPAGEAACRRFLAKLPARLRLRPAGRVLRCFAGLTVVAVPIAVDGTAVAALVCGELFSNRPHGKALSIWLHRLRSRGLHLEPAAARQALLETPVISARQLRATRQLLGGLAAELQNTADICLRARPADDPQCVVSAKSFVKAHLNEMPRTAAAAQAAHVSPAYFCRAFRAATGMTFSEYVSRCRIEKARNLLAREQHRITEVAFAAGFRSIPHFNHTFKRFTGLSPRDYRGVIQRSGRLPRS